MARLRSSGGLGALALILAASLPAVAQQVWIVDADGQGDFLEIQEAVDAAQDGDAVLVYPRMPSWASYAGFEIQGKGISVSAAEGAFVRTREILVRDLPAGQAVDLTRLIVSGSAGNFPISVRDCAGAVALYDCRVPSNLTVPALLASAAEDLTLVDTEINGGEATAVDATSSFLAVYGGMLRGGSGKYHDWGQSGDGHPALRLHRSRALLHGTHLRGGTGGDTCSGVPGDGGPGLEALHWSEAYGVAAVLQGGFKGTGGCVFLCSSCLHGEDGPDLYLDPTSSWFPLGDTPRRLTAPGEAGEGTTISLHLAGAPGDQVYIARAGEPAFRFLPQLLGVLHAGGEAAMLGVPVGVLPAHGLLAVELPLHDLPAGAQVERLRAQMVVLDQDGQLALGSLAVVHVLDEAVSSPCAGVIHVRAGALPGGDGASWETAFADLQDALALAEDKRALCFAAPVEIWVAQGTYTPAPPGGSREARFTVLDRMRLLGGFAGTETSASERDPAAHPTILSGDLLGDDTPGFGNRSDNSYNVVRIPHSSATPAALLDGFTIRGGHAVGSPSSIQREGGGVHVGTRATLRRCRIEDNYALERGGGLYLSAGSIPRWIVDCIISGNRAGLSGGGVYAGISAHFLNCLFAENEVEAPGGTGGGLLTVSTIWWAQVSVVNCVFDANRAGTAAALGIHLPLNPLQGNFYPVTNTTIVDNEATLAGGSAVWVTDGWTVMQNSILWGNTAKGVADQAAQLAALPPALALASFSCIQGLVDDLGPGNISSDPLLDAALELLGGSPCIDAGDNSLVPPDVLDLDGDLDVWEPLPFDRLGNPRFVDDPAAPNVGLGEPPIVDMGAHERQVR